MYFIFCGIYMPTTCITSFCRRIALHITNTLLRYIRKRLAFMLFPACFHSFILFLSSARDRLSRISIGRQSPRRCPGSEGHVSLGCRSEERIQTASRGPSLITSDPDKIPRHAHGPRDAAIRFSSLPRGIC